MERKVIHSDEGVYPYDSIDDGNSALEQHLWFQQGVLSLQKSILF
jgi:hypothetical protein